MKLKTVSRWKPAENTPGQAIPALDELANPILKRILVPVDFSPSSRKALKYAVHFAKQLDAEIFLLHVLEPIPPPAPEYMMTGSLSGDAGLLDLATEELTKWRDQVDPAVVVKSSIEFGGAHREIIHYAAANHIHLIVIGMRGHSGLAHFLFGSTAEQVVRHAVCPVTVVRDAAPPAEEADTMERRAEAPLALASPAAAA